MERENNSGGFSNGFVLGAIVGAGAMFLFATKRGRKLFKTLTDEGWEGVLDLKDALNEEMEDMEEFEEEPINEPPTAAPKTASKPKHFFKTTKK